MSRVSEGVHEGVRDKDVARGVSRLPGPPPPPKIYKKF